MHPSFQYPQYLLRRQVLALTGVFRIYNLTGDLVAYSRQKMFKLREDIRLWSSEDRTTELLNIQARHVVDFSAAYDVIDSQTGQRAGMLRRRGLSSLARDTWLVYDATGRQVGVLLEDDLARALLRRFLLGSWLPQNYDLLSAGAPEAGSLQAGGGRLADLRQRFNPFRYELEVDLRENIAGALDPRLALAAALLVAVIEGRQD